MLTSLQAFQAIFGLVDRHASAEDACSALRLAVDRLLVTEAGVFFEALARKLYVAEFAKGSAQRAREGEMVRHHDPRYLCVAKIGAWRRIKLACVQMSLKVTKI